jgi:hypothetical protein
MLEEVPVTSARAQAEPGTQEEQKEEESYDKEFWGKNYQKLQDYNELRYTTDPYLLKAAISLM